MVDFVNTGNSIGLLFYHFTSNISGSLFMTVTALVFILILIGLVFGIPLELTVVLVLPILIGAMAFSREFVTIGGVILLYLAVVFAKWWVLRF